MLFNNNLYIKISRRAASRTLLAFAGKSHSITGINPCWNTHRKIFGFFNPALTAAIIAWIFDHLAGAATIRAGLLHGKKTLLHAYLANPAAHSTAYW